MIHQGKYRFNQAGQLVDHTGKVLTSPEKGGTWREAKKVLNELRNKKPDFFSPPSTPSGPLMFEFQKDWVNPGWTPTYDDNCT
jgi:hypothetical protein